MLPKLHFNAIFGTQCIKKHEGVHREFYRSLLMVGGKSWGNFVSGISATLWEFVAMKVVRSSGYLLLVKPEHLQPSNISEEHSALRRHPGAQQPNTLSPLRWQV